MVIKDNTYMRYLQNEIYIPKELKSKKNKKLLISLLSSVALLSSLAIALYLSDFQNILLTERIRMRKGLPFYDLWKNPPLPMFTKAYAFNVTNSERFLKGLDTQLKIEEVGPFFYYKYPRQNDVVFNDENSTLTYTTTYDIEYPEELNTPGIMNKTIIVPNTILLTIASIVNDHINNFFTRSAINMMLIKEPLFVNKTIYEFLWDNTSPIVELVKPFIPSTLFPRTNVGILYNYFYPEKMRFNVNIGTQYGFREFFKINSLNSKPYIVGFKDRDYEDCKIYSIQEGRDGTGLPPYFNKDDDVIKAYTFMIPRTYPTIYSRDKQIGLLNVYDCRFQEGIYKRFNDSTLNECLGKTGSTPLPEGLIDTSKILFGVPFALSPPHFYGFNGVWENYLSGLAGNEEDHGSYMHYEPISGIPLTLSASLQVNLVLPRFTFGSQIRLFSGKILPIAWVNYKYELHRSSKVMAYVYISVFLPTFQNILTSLVGAYLLYKLYLLVKLVKTIVVNKMENEGLEFRSNSQCIELMDGKESVYTKDYDAHDNIELDVSTELLEYRDNIQD